MINSIEIQCLRLPPAFAFHSLHLNAQFQTATVSIASVSFRPETSERKRVVPLDVLLRLPPSRTQFLLILSVLIINLHIPEVTIKVDLN